jgi:hypothetical protein
MRWLLTPILWLLAVLVALGVLWRLWRGHNVVLRGRWKPRFIRMVVVILVVLGVGVEKGDSAPVGLSKQNKTKTEDALPPSVTPDVLARWIELQAPRGPWLQFKQTFTRLGYAEGRTAARLRKSVETLAQRLPERFRALVLADLKALGEGKEAPRAGVRELTAALDELERAGYCDNWISAYLWRKTAGALDGAERRPVVDLFARLCGHARLANALVRAQAQVRPLMQPPRAWMGKGGGMRFPPGGFQGGGPRGAGIAAQLLQSLRQLYPTSDTGTWEHGVLVSVTVGKGSAPVTLVRAGQGQVPQAEGQLMLGRLDLLETTAGDRPVILEHAWLGRLELPAGRLLSVWELPAYLSEKGKAEARKVIADALAGNAGAARRLEQMLPLAHALLRDALATSPKAGGAPRLRLILGEFDELPAPRGPGGGS